MGTRSIGLHLERLRHFWWVAALVFLVFLAGGAAAASRAETTYSSRATLGVMSQLRAPEQDAMLAQGYVDLFNQPGTQASLYSSGAVAESATVTAELAAPSPLIYIVASSTDSGVVRAAANDSAIALRNTVNDALRESRVTKIQELRKPVEEIRAANGFIPDYVLTQLEQQINQINASTTNQVEVIELASETSSTASDALSTFMLAAAAGLVVGCAVALALGSLTRRVGGSKDLSFRTGIRVLATLPALDNRNYREQLRRVLNDLASPTDTPRIIALAAPRAIPDVGDLAGEVLTELTTTGYRVAVVQTDPESTFGGPLSASSLAPPTGPIDATITESETSPGVFVVMRTGGSGVTAMDRHRTRALLDELRRRVDVVLVVAAPLIETARGPAAVAESDAVIVLCRRSETRIDDVRESRRVVEHLGAEILGAVITTRGTVGSSPENSEPVEPLAIDLSTAARVR